MKFHRNLWVILFTTAILLAVVVYSGTPGPILAQTASKVVVYSVQAGPTGDKDKKTLTLDILFGLKDATGSASSDNPNTSADVLLDNGSGATPAKIRGDVSKPTTGMNIELAIDLSGSMGR